eukprot:GHVH01004397.1.p1 GENE.GHVH01004397.1~~GHVH01004397.1.p1  ORF type:complete len:334 (-),score=30.73 GHVH01004397.1:167-1168(-)
MRIAWSSDPLSSLIERHTTIAEVIDTMYRKLGEFIKCLHQSHVEEFEDLVYICGLKAASLQMASEIYDDPIRSMRYDWTPEEVEAIINSDTTFCVIPWYLTVFAHVKWEFGSPDHVNAINSIWSYCHLLNDERSDQLNRICSLILSGMIIISQKYQERTSDKRLNPKVANNLHGDSYLEYLVFSQSIASRAFGRCSIHCEVIQNRTISEGEDLCYECLIELANQGIKTREEHINTIDTANGSKRNQQQHSKRLCFVDIESLEQYLQARLDQLSVRSKRRRMMEIYTAAHPVVSLSSELCISSADTSNIAQIGVLFALLYEVMWYYVANMNKQG